MSGLYFDELKVGDVFQTPARTIGESDIIAFAGLSGDFNPLHVDEESARAAGFPGRIAHGMLSASIASGFVFLAGMTGGSMVALVEVTWKFFKPVRPGDTIRGRVTVLEKRKVFKKDQGLLVRRCEVVNQRCETVLDGTALLLMRRGPEQSPQGTSSSVAS